MADRDIFSPGTWQFWSNSNVRPKRTFEAILLFGDLMFGGSDLGAFPPYMVKNFSRPGYDDIETQIGEYQLDSGDYAKIDYPTQGFKTKPLKVTLADVNVFGTQGADTAGHIQAALSMMQKTWKFEETAMAHREGDPNPAYSRLLDGYIEGSPQIITILELDGRGGANGEWSVYKPVLTSVAFSDVNYENENIATVDLTFAYKNFKFTQGWSERQLERRLDAAAAGAGNNLSSWENKGSKWLVRGY
jgi:hypothetical protein